MEISLNLAVTYTSDYQFLCFGKIISSKKPKTRGQGNILQSQTKKTRPKAKLLRTIDRKNLRTAKGNQDSRQHSLPKLKEALPILFKHNTIPCY